MVLVVQSYEVDMKFSFETDCHLLNKWMSSIIMKLSKALNMMNQCTALGLETLCQHERIYNLQNLVYINCNQDNTKGDVINILKIRNNAEVRNIFV